MARALANGHEAIDRHVRRHLFGERGVHSSGDKKHHFGRFVKDICRQPKAEVQTGAAGVR